MCLYFFFLQELVNSGVVDPATYTPLNSNFTAVNAAHPHTSTPSSAHPVEDTEPAAPTSPSISGLSSTLQEAAPATDAPSVPSNRAAAGASPSQRASSSERYPETVEALRNVGKLKERFDKLEARVAALEEVKVDQSQLTHLRELITNEGNFMSPGAP